MQDLYKAGDLRVPFPCRHPGGPHERRRLCGTEETEPISSETGVRSSGGPVPPHFLVYRGTAHHGNMRNGTVQYGTVQLTSEHGPRQLATLLPRLSGKRKATSTALSGQGHQFISVMHMTTSLCGTLLQGSAQGGFIYHQRLLYVGRVGPPRRSSSILSAKVADTRPVPGYRAHLQTLIAAGSPLNITGPPVGAGRRQLGRPRRLGPVARHTVRGRPDTDRGG